MWCEIYFLYLLSFLIFLIHDYSNLFMRMFVPKIVKSVFPSQSFFHHVTFFTFLEFHYLLLNILPLLTVLHLSRIRSFQFFFISVLFHSFKYFFDYDNTFTFYSKTSSSLPLSSFSSITQPCHSLIIF